MLLIVMVIMVFIPFLVPGCGPFSDNYSVLYNYSSLCRCPFGSNVVGNFRLHVKNVHDKIKDIFCPHCAYATGYPTNLRMHFKHCAGAIRAAAEAAAAVASLGESSAAGSAAQMP